MQKFIRGVSNRQEGNIADMTIKKDKRARLLCAWCLAEGKSEEEAMLGWTETFDGEPSHGICKHHYDIEIAKAMQMLRPDKKGGGDVFNSSDHCCAGDSIGVGRP